MSNFDRPSCARCCSISCGIGARSSQMTARQTFSPSRASATPKAAAFLTAGCRCARSSMGAGWVVWVGVLVDGGGMDVVAATDDQVLLAANDLQVALGIEPSQVAAQEPAAAVEGLLGARLIAEIAEHQLAASATDLADLARRGLQVRVLRVPEAHL